MKLFSEVAVEIMHRNIRALLNGGLLIVLGSGMAARADVIRVDFQPNSAFSGRAPVNFNGVEAQAAAANPVFGSNGSNTWNYLSLAPYPTTTSNPSFSNLVNSAGAATTVGISFTGALSAADDSPIDNVGSDGVENDYFFIDAGSASATALYTITGLPANTQVALYLYSPNFRWFDSVNSVNRPSRAYTLTASGQTISVPSGTGTGNNALAFVQTNVLGQIVGTWSTAGNEGDWSGFQIAFSPATPAPEPASTSLLCLSFGLLIALGRRARRKSV